MPLHNSERDKNFIPRFDRRFIDSDEDFHWIGEGSYGGKASGLAVIKKILSENFNKEDFPDIQIFVPKMIVIRTNVFKAFMERNNLYEFAFNEKNDIRIVNAFLQADLPVEILGDLRSIISNINSPLAIRSSSMLEDAKYEPFAGIYTTKMISNNLPNIDARFQKLIEAIKFVYASTYFKKSKDYFKISSNSIEDEQMAVIIQEVVGKNHNNRFYPHISGVARSYNFYAIGKSKPEQGTVSLALGLGKTIVDGGIGWNYCPIYPKSVPPYGDPQNMLKYTQTTFWTVNMNPIVSYDPTKDTEYLSLCDFYDAEYDNTLKFTASTYLSSENKIVMGVNNEGPRILNFARLLQLNEFRFNEMMLKLMKVCEEAFNNPIEIEFASVISKEEKKMKFGFLQVRPMVVSNEIVEIDDQEFIYGSNLVVCNRTIGNGIINNIKDIVFVKPEVFDKKSTIQIAKEIDHFNRQLVEQKRPYLLIGFGRWGSSDPWLGIPVEWGQISGAKVIIESTLSSINVELSQGSHFFHNLTSFKVCYFSINYDGNFMIDWDWLNMQKIVAETEFVKYINLSIPLSIKVDGRTGRGIIKKW